MTSAAMIANDTALRSLIENPFALTLDQSGPKQPGDQSANFDELAQSWCCLFVIATISTKNLHWTNHFLNYPCGRDITYDERVLTGRRVLGWLRAQTLTASFHLQNKLLELRVSQKLLRLILPKPGNGPNKEQCDNGYNKLRYMGRSPNGRSLSIMVEGNSDPGYSSTCKLIAESALGLSLEIGREKISGGVWTPGGSMGSKLIDRLIEKSCLSFKVET